MYLNLVVPLLFLVFSALANEIAPPKCGPGEIYKKCGTCDAGCKEPKPICSKECRSGCFCQDGLVRDNDSNCIPREKCPGGCKDGEIYKECGGCEKSCKNPNPGCSGQCQKGCFCIDGYVRNDKGLCVPAKECRKCNPGEVYSECGTCDKSCKVPNPVCTEECKIGCFCIDGYVRNNKGQCVPAKECRKCNPGEVYSKCGTCDKSCKVPNPVCTKECKIGCFCIDGYVRNDKGRCIPKEKCRVPECKDGEVYTTCGTCDGTCDNPNPICTQHCRVGCYCKKDYLRNGAGRCVPAKQCPAPRCKCNEVYKDCGTCDGTCDNPKPICAQVCTKGCFCKKDHVRDKEGNCIPVKDCCGK